MFLLLLPLIVEYPIMSETPETSSNIEPQTSPHWSVNTKAIVASAAVILVAILAWRFRSLWSSVVIAILLAYLLNPAC